MSAGDSSAPPYFFLSYARVPPSGGMPADEGGSRNTPVDRFFSDLVERVRRLADRPPSRIGLYDHAVNPGQDRQSAVTEALSRAEVLVPLYSPRYFSGAWTLSERRSFEARVRAAHADPAAHIQPVLWLPFPEGPPDLADEVHGLADVPEYHEFGLGALCELAQIDQAYRGPYEQVLSHLARRIVQVAEQSPIGPSPLPVPVAGPVSDPAVADFVIGVFASTAGARTAASGRGAYGSRPVDWSPFADIGAAPIAAQAAYVAERLDLTVAVVSIPGEERLWANRPGVLLVDGWSVVDETGASMLRAAVQDLPAWVSAAVVTGRHPQEVVELLVAATADRAIPTAADSTEFLNLMPVLITQARRRFFSAMPKSYPSRPRFGVRTARGGAGENGER